MTNQLIYLLPLFSIISFLIFLKGFNQTTKNSNAFKLTPFFGIMGIFVWADAVVLGLFWTIVPLICFVLKDSLLFLLTFSLFWLVRSLGELIYWLNQQFSPINRNPPESLVGFKYFKNDSIWFIYQLFYQCLIVITTITSIYLTSVWLASR